MVARWLAVLLDITPKPKPLLPVSEVTGGLAGGGALAGHAAGAGGPPGGAPRGLRRRGHGWPGRPAAAADAAHQAGATFSGSSDPKNSCRLNLAVVQRRTFHVPAQPHTVATHGRNCTRKGGARDLARESKAGAGAVEKPSAPMQESDASYLACSTCAEGRDRHGSGDAEPERAGAHYFTVPNPPRRTWR